MATKDEPNYITLEQMDERIADIVGKVYQRVSKETSDQVNGAIAKHIKPLDETISGISEALKNIQPLVSKVEATEAYLSEIRTALEAPDDDGTQPSTPPSVDTEAITAKIKEDLSKDYLERIQSLEKAVVEARDEKEAIRRQQIESDRNNALISSLKKIAPELNLFPEHEEIVMEKLAKDKVLQVAEDGTAWLAKTKVQDPFTKQVEERVVPATPDILKSIISESYSYYQQPRGGAGVNAAPTQSYSPTNRKITDTTTPTDIQQGFAKGDESMLNEIAALIASGA